MTLKLNFQTRKETKENGIARWLGSDTQERYNKNLNIFGADWKYADVDISYDLNSQGYRCSEFDQISWEDSVLFFGCSIVLGVGLPINETLPYLVEKNTGSNTVNLGQVAASQLYNAVNLQKIIDYGIRPKAVVVCHPSVLRTTVFQEKEVLSHGPWCLGTEGKPVPKLHREYARHYLEDQTNADTMSIFHERCIRALCNSAGIPVVQTTWYDLIPGSELTLTPFINDDDKQDLARDVWHPGLRTMTNAAQIIASLLDNEGVK